MSAERIAAYLDGGLTGEEREDLERHLLTCAECRADLSEASDLTAQRSVRLSRWTAGAAAAAAGLLLVLVGLPQADRRGTAGTVLRGPALAAPQIDVVSPPDGSSASADSLVFTWRAADVDAHYVFTLTSAEGDVIFSMGQPDTMLALPRSVGLQSGAEYFWVVDALMDGARSTTTGFQGFVVR